MKIYITDTDKYEHLVYAAPTGEDMLPDLIAYDLSVTYDCDLDCYTMTTESYKWWCEYIDNAEMDAIERERLVALYGDEMVDELIAEEMELIGEDMDAYHAAYQRAFARAEEECNTTAAKLHRQRTLRGLTQQELGALVGCQNSMISRWELGNRIPTVACLKKLAAALGCSVTDLI